MTVIKKNLFCKVSDIAEYLVKQYKTSGCQYMLDYIRLNESCIRKAYSIIAVKTPRGSTSDAAEVPFYTTAYSYSTYLINEEAVQL